MSTSHTPVKINFPHQLEHVYTTYSAMVYGVAIKISTSQQEADEVFVDTFVKVYHQFQNSPGHSFSAIQLIRLAMQTSHQQKYKSDNEKNSPLFASRYLHTLHKFIFNEQRAPGINLNIKIDQFLTGRQIREQFLPLKNGTPIRAAMWIA